VTESDFIRACEAIPRQRRWSDGEEFWKTWLRPHGRWRRAGRDPEVLTATSRPSRPTGALAAIFSRAFDEAGLTADDVAAYEAFHDTLCRGWPPDTRPALGGWRRTSGWQLSRTPTTTT
jgi:hypothetical protein